MRTGESYTSLMAPGESEQRWAETREIHDRVRQLKPTSSNEFLQYEAKVRHEMYAQSTGDFGYESPDDIAFIQDGLIDDLPTGHA